MVFANILARPLCTMAKDLAANLAPGGTAILSGLLRSSDAPLSSPELAVVQGFFERLGGQAGQRAHSDGGHDEGGLARRAQAHRVTRPPSGATAMLTPRNRVSLAEAPAVRPLNRV